MGARPLQGLDLMPSSLNDSLRTWRRRLVMWVAELLGSLVDLLRPLLELLGLLDRPRRVAGKRSQLELGEYQATQAAGGMPAEDGRLQLRP